MRVVKNSLLFALFRGALYRTRFRVSLRFLVSLSVALFPLWCFAASEDPSQQPIQIEVLPQFHSLSPNQKYSLALRVKVEKGWHIYWKEPGRFGLPTIFQILVNGEALEGAERWSVPGRKMFEDGGVSYEYREPFVVVVGPYEAPLESRVLEVKVRGKWLACTVDICVPKEGGAEVRIPIEKSLTLRKESREFSSLRESLPNLYELTFLSASHPPAVHASPGSISSGQSPTPIEPSSSTEQRLILSFAEVLKGGGAEFAGSPHVAAYGGRTHKFEGGKFVSGFLPKESLELSFSSRGGVPLAGSGREVRQIEGFLFFEEAVAAFLATPVWKDK